MNTFFPSFSGVAGSLDIGVFTSPGITIVLTSSSPKSAVPALNTAYAVLFAGWKHAIRMNVSFDFPAVSASFISSGEKRNSLNVENASDTYALPVTGLTQ